MWSSSLLISVFLRVSSSLKSDWLEESRDEVKPIATLAQTSLTAYLVTRLLARWHSIQIMKKNSDFVRFERFKRLLNDYFTSDLQIKKLFFEQDAENHFPSLWYLISTHFSPRVRNPGSPGAQLVNSMFLLFAAHVRRVWFSLPEVQNVPITIQVNTLTYNLWDILKLTKFLTFTLVDDFHVTQWTPPSSVTRKENDGTSVT